MKFLATFQTIDFLDTLVRLTRVSRKSIVWKVARNFMSFL